jgi:hypothetical protein
MNDYETRQMRIKRFGELVDALWRDDENVMLKEDKVSVFWDWMLEILSPLM